MIQTALASSCFIDSNIWIYAFTVGAPAKTAVAQQVVGHHTLTCLSTQVINEVCVNLLKTATFTQLEIADLIDDMYRKYQVIELNHPILRHAVDIRVRYRLSFWDSLIVASAAASGTTLIYSEDMQHGQIIEGMTLRNPFLPEVSLI